MAANECRKTCATITLWLVCCLMYLSIGMVIFVAIEAENTNKIIAHKKELRENTREQIKKRMNFTQQQFSKFMKNISDAFSPFPMEWTYPSAFGLSLQTITTIGYGNITPLTTVGRVFCIFYSLFGVPLAALLLQSTGNAIYDVIRFIIIAVEEKVRKKPVVRHAEFKSLVGSILLLFLVILSFGTTEEYYIDGVYGWFITLTTIGYGDVIPGKVKLVYSWIRLLFMFVGLSFMSSVLNSLGSWISESRNMKLCNCCKFTRKQQLNGNGVEMDEHEDTSGTYRKKDGI